MNLYRIKRNKDNKYYTGKSKFTKYGTYFRIEQIKMNIEWVISKYNQYDISIEIYEIQETDTINLSSDDNLDVIIKKINRNININDILK